MLSVRVDVVLTVPNGGGGGGPRGSRQWLLCVWMMSGRYYFRLIGQRRGIVKNRVFIVIEWKIAKWTGMWAHFLQSSEQRVQCECDSWKQRVYCDRNDSNDMLLNSLSVYSWLHSAERCPHRYLYWIQYCGAAVVKCEIFANWKLVDRKLEIMSKSRTTDWR